MKEQTLVNTLKRLNAAIIVLGLIVALPVTYADDEKPKIKIKENKLKIKGEGAREMLKPEVTATFVDGYTVPAEYHTHFNEIPSAETNMVVRYRNGRAYYVNKNDWKINRVVDIDSTVEVSADDNAFVAGYVIPETHRSHFVEVPHPDAGLSVRYYNNTAYYMDPSYRIVRTMRLVP